MMLTAEKQQPATAKNGHGQGHHYRLSHQSPQNPKE
jgi:hypothetical protein